MVFCEASNIHYLWDKHFESMLEDYHRTMSNNLKCVQQISGYTEIIEQVSGYTEIIEHVIRRKGRVFFVDGPGGTGKIFL
jgi:hypothetical protein